MSHRLPPPPVRTPSKEPRAHFDWPPTDDLAPYRGELLQRDTEVEDAGIQADQPLAVDVSPATDAMALFPSEAQGRRLPAVPDQPSPTASDSRIAVVGDRLAAEAEYQKLVNRLRVILPEPEPFRAGPACSSQPSTPGDSAQARSPGDDLEHSSTEATSTSAIAVSPSASARDLPASADLADEIAHLQTLIEELTQKIDWRIPTVNPR